MEISIKSRIKTKIKKLPIISNLVYAKELSTLYKNENKHANFHSYLKDNFKNIIVVRRKKNKFKQIAKLINVVGIKPTNNDNYFYSIDENKTMSLSHRIFDNNSIDYSWVVNSYLGESFINSKLSLEQYDDIISELKYYVSFAKDTHYA